MQLFYSSTSPFVRKCLVTAFELNGYDELDILTDNNPHHAPKVTHSKDESLFDSTLICEQLNKIKGGALFGDETSRWDILKEHALADNIMTTILLVRYEINSSDDNRRQWALRLLNRVNTSLRYFETNSATVLARPINIALITLACSLSYLDFALPSISWRSDFPILAKWLDEFSQRPSMLKTEYRQKI